MLKRKKTQNEITKEDIDLLTQKMLNKNVLHTDLQYERKVKQDAKEIEAKKKRNEKAKKIVAKTFKLK
ncbi:MAG: hypothetical protein UDG86_06110 [Lachnospiraceae bacterium]|jgi:hypothetical protein|nr:hypothetical protein [Lachnospiraceae bacterium]